MIVTEEAAIKTLHELWRETNDQWYEETYMMAIEALSANAAKKKAELKENGDWDCPDVGCNECDHHRSVEWCSLAIPNHEEIDDTYKMINEAFFEGIEAAEKQYRFLIEYVEELDKKSADVAQGEWEYCEHEIANHVDGYKCSNCGFFVPWDYEHKFINFIEDYNFCPSCGADMRGENK